MQVEAGGGEHGIGAIAVAAFELVAAHAVLGLEMTDHRLDRGAALRLAADVADDAPEPGAPEFERAAGWPYAGKG